MEKQEKQEPDSPDRQPNTPAVHMAARMLINWIIHKKTTDTPVETMQDSDTSDVAPEGDYAQHQNSN